jgi:hypothetical protein
MASLGPIAGANPLPNERAYTGRVGFEPVRTRIAPLAMTRVGVWREGVDGTGAAGAGASQEEAGAGEPLGGEETPLRATFCRCMNASCSADSPPAPAGSAGARTDGAYAREFRPIDGCIGRAWSCSVPKFPR